MKGKTETATSINRGFAYLVILPGLLLIGIVMLYPICYSLYLSLHQQNLARPWAGTVFVGLGNYAKAFQTAAFRQAFWQTLYFVGISIFVELLLGLGLALLLHQTFRGRNLVRGVVLLPWMLTPVVVAFMWGWILNDVYGVGNYLLLKVGLIDSPIQWLSTVGLAMRVIIAIDIWRETPFVSVILLAGLQGIPREASEAAKVDGANAWQRFLYITLPFLEPAIMVALLMRTMVALRFFDIIYVMTKGGPASSTEVLATYTYKKAFVHFDMGFASAAATIILLLSLGISLTYIKFLSREQGIE